jgi:hypothetical protein
MPLYLFLLACTLADLSLEGTLTRPELTGTWLEVSQHQGKPVILEPCDAGVRSVQLKGDLLVVGWGQEATEYTVRSVEGDGDTLEIEVLAQGADTPQTLTARKTAQGLRWTVEGSPFDTVPESSPLPRMKECCASTPEDPVPHSVSVIPQGQVCPR